MNDLTPEQRARALELHDIHYTTIRGYESPVSVLHESEVRAWMAVEAHVLASHTCQPVWRPTTAEEIQAGWEVRARRRDGSGSVWGVAHRQDGEGDWCTESGRLLTWAAGGWTYETTAPIPEPEPWPDELVDCLEDALIQADFTGARPRHSRALLDALAARYPGVRDAITEGEQS